MTERPYLDSPFRIDGRGRTAVTPTDDHVRDMIYEILFTAPGERVNRPDFGCGIRRMVFLPNHDALAVSTQFLVQGALERWMAGIIETKSVRVENRDDRLVVQVVYVRIETDEQQEVTFFAPPAAL